MSVWLNEIAGAPQLDQRREDIRILTRQTRHINNRVTKTRLFTKWVQALINSVALCKCNVLNSDVVFCTKWQSARLYTTCYVI